MAVAGMAGMPDKEVRKLVNEFGREPGDRHAGRCCRQLAARRDSLEPAARAICARRWSGG